MRGRLYGQNRGVHVGRPGNLSVYLQEQILRGIVYRFVVVPVCAHFEGVDVGYFRWL